MKNKYLSRETFTEMTTSLGETLISLSKSTHLTDDEAYEMVMLLMQSYVNAVVPTKEEN